MAAPPTKPSPLHRELAEKMFYGTLTTDEMFDIWVREQSAMLLALPDGDKKNALFVSLPREQKILLFSEKPNSWVNFQIMIHTAESAFGKAITALTPPDRN